MKNSFNSFKKTTLILGTFITIFGLQSCQSTPASDPTPVTNFSVIGAWALTDASVTIDGKAYTITKENVAKSPVSTEDISFSSDGKYIRGKESGTWSILGSQIILNSQKFEVMNLDTCNLQVGNSFDASTAKGDQMDVFYTSQKLLDQIKVSLPSTAKNTKYQLNYKKK